LDLSPQHARRAALTAGMGRGIAIIPTAPERPRNRDSDFPYRFDSYFHYLSGFPEPESVVVLVAGDAPKSILFCREKNLEREIWDGYRYGPEAARETFGFDEAHALGKLDEMMPQLMSNRHAVFFAPGIDPAWDARVMGWLNAVRALVRTGVTAPAEIRDVHVLLDEMRLIKDPSEIATMRRAGTISAEAHCRAMRSARPGLAEYHLEAEILHQFRREGSQFPAYGSIVAGGPNACVLHYRENDRILCDGDLVLIDAGCELDGYASDITRTFPVNGKFSAQQKAVYDIVLAAQAAAIAEIRPGTTWDRPHDMATRVLAQGMIDLGLCKGPLEVLIESGDYKRFYMHRTGHWLGRDVHDCGDYKKDGEWRPLRPGMVLTVEPGFYIREADDIPQEFWNIGVRIEDDALVTETGCEIITTGAPKTTADIESLMREAKA
jgi:Xaa-Pro aminopeptidase